jgi:hypothetical protein
VISTAHRPGGSQPGLVSGKTGRKTGFGIPVCEAGEDGLGLLDEPDGEAGKVSLESRSTREAALPAGHPFQDGRNGPLFRRLWRRGPLDITEDQSFAREAVGDNASVDYFLGRGEAQFPGLMPRRKFPTHLRSQAGIARVEPIEIPAGREFDVEPEFHLGRAVLKDQEFDAAKRLLLGRLRRSKIFGGRNDCRLTGTHHQNHRKRHQDGPHMSRDSRGTLRLHDYNPC